MRKLISISLLSAVLASGPALAQSTFGSILGAVTDPNSALMPGAQVLLTNQETGIARQTTSNEAGLYEFPDLVAGIYRLQVRHDGFKTFLKVDIPLGARQAVRVDAVMELGALTETITVTSTPGLIETENAALSGTVPGGEFHFLSPTTDSQRPWTLMRLNPLVQNTNSGTRFTMGGAYYNQAEFQIDGISAPLGAGGPAGSTLMTSESVGEVKILAVNNSAEYASPGVFQQVSKGGGNALHGDAYYNYNTPGLNAREAPASVKTSRLFHMFGGNIGGPIVLPKLYSGRNRTFFSLSWQSKRERGNTLYRTAVPTLDQRKGIFDVVVRDPTNGLPFVGNAIPASRINFVSSKLQEYYPEPGSAPAGATNNFEMQGPGGTSREEALDLRLDWRISDRHWAYTRVGGMQFNTRGFASNLPTMGYSSVTRKLYSGVISYNFNVRPTLLNEFRGGFTRDNDPATGPNNGLEVLRKVGIQFPTWLSPPDVRGFPVIDITGPQILSQGAVTRRATPSYQVTDTLSWIRGRHTFKAGINLFAEQPNYSTIPSGVHGKFVFRATYTGQAYADFLLGIPYQTVVTNISPGRYMRSTNYGLFFQDDFKVRPSLTLNLGLRWDYQGPIYNKTDGLYNFDPASGGLIRASARTLVNPAFTARWASVPLPEASQVGLPERTLHFPDRNNFAPRIGFAWRPRNASNFVVRGGWGKFTDLLGQGLYAKLAEGGFLNRGDIQMNNPGLTASRTLPAGVFVFPYPFPAAGSESGPGLPGNGFDPRLFNPYVQQWNLTLERALGEFSVRASYLGTKGTNLVYAADLNQRRIPGDDKSRPYSSKGFTGGIAYMRNGGSQIYHGLQLEARRRLSRGFMLETGYVFGKNISDVLDQNDDDAKGTSTDAFNRGLDRGRVGYHRKHNFTAAAIWEVPVGRGHRLGGGSPRWVNQAVSGWTIDLELFAGSGQWFTPCRVANNPLTNLGCDTQTARPDRIGDGNDGPRLTGGPGLKWINTTAFAEPAAGVLGTSGRTVLEGPGFWHPSTSLTKKVRFRENKELWLSVAAMNVFNHPNFRSPGGTNSELVVNQTAFGSTSSLLNTDRAADRSKSRAIWLRLRFLF